MEPPLANNCLVQCLTWSAPNHRLTEQPIFLPNTAAAQTKPAGKERLPTKYGTLCPDFV